MIVLYIIFLSIGVGYALVALVSGGLSHFNLPGIDFDHDGVIDLGGEVKIPSLSPIAIASFITAFGGFGLIGLLLFDGSPVGSLGAAVVGGFVIAAAAHLAFTYFLIKPQGSSEVTMKDVIGAVAEVVTPIPMDSVGEIALVAQGGRLTYPAKSATGQPISRNTTVVVERMVGGIAFVRPQS